ncbi:OmpA family protein [Thalassobaculum sp.]|uniref:OmpA family protein n=1 Tax=Thalassobaculum sp. TaxID=2022740 RepID=UPI0032EC6EC4
MIQKTRIAMATSGRRMVKVLAVVGMVGLTGCSSIPDAVNPVEWYRGTSNTIGGWFEDEPAKDGAAPSSTTVAGDPGPSSNTEYPNLATVPARPTPSTTPEQRETLKQGLIADRANARYTDAPAAQPAPVQAAPVQSAPRSTAPQSKQTPPPEPISAVPVPAPSTKPQAAVPASTPPSSASRLAAGANDQSALWPNRPAPQTPSITGATTAEVGGEHVRRAMPQSEPTPVPARVSAPSSSAPALTSQLAERTTLDSAGNAGRAPAPRPEAAAAPSSAPAAVPSSSAPTASGQSVIVNDDALDAVPAAASFSGQPYLASTVYFGHSSARLTGTERAELAKVAQTAASSGAAVRVIGHASSRTADLDLRAHEVANFTMSLKRANAVADVLVHAGVPADRIRIDALGDSQPEFYEVMPAGEAGNRRVEVFLIY